MTKFKLLFGALLTMLLLSSCSTITEDEKKSIKICPQCNMELPKSNIHTATIKHNSVVYYFDDPGCMVLWAKKNELDLKNTQVKIFSNDTKKYIDANAAFFKIDERTPMLYGFSAYENSVENSIDFDEVIIRMLRGEHMANPKIRKHILGY